MMATGDEGGHVGEADRWFEVEPGMIAKTSLFIPLAATCDAKDCRGITSEDH